MQSEKSPLKKFAESLIAPAWEFTLQRWGSGAAGEKAAELKEIDVVKTSVDEGWVDVRLSIEVVSMDANSLYNLAMFMTRLEQGYGHPFKVDEIVSGRAVISGRMIVPAHRLGEFDRIMEDYGRP